MEDIQLNLLRVILNKPEKSTDDLRLLSELLLQTPLKESLFKQLGAFIKNEAKIFELCKGLRYKFCLKGDVVFQEGHSDTDDIYFVIRGNVGVFKKSVFATDTICASRNSEITASMIDSPANKSVHFGPNSNFKGLPALRRQSSIKRATRFAEQSPNVSTSKLSIKNPFAVIVKLKSIIQKTREPHNKSELDDEDRLPIRSQKTMGTESKRRESIGPAFQRRISLFAGKPRKSQIFRPQDSNVQIERAFINMFEGERFLNRVNFKTIFSPSNEEEEGQLKMFQELYLNDTSSVDDNKLMALTTKYGKQIAQLSDWSVFGEFSQHLGTSRTASIIALNNTELICMKRELYNNLVKDLIRSKKSKLVKFVLDILKMTNKSQNISIVISMIPHIQKIKVRKGEVIANQGDLLSKMYIVKKGEIKLSKEIREEPLSVYYSSMTKDHIEDALKYFRSQTLQVGLCGPNEVLGEEFLFSQNPAQECTMACASMTATLLVFRNSIFKNLPSAIRETWQTIHSKKKDFRVNNFENTINMMLKNRKKLNQTLQSVTKASRGSIAKENALVNPPEKACSFTQLLKLSAQFGTLLQEYKRKKKHLNHSSIVQLQDFDLEPKANTSVHLINNLQSPMNRCSSQFSKIKLVSLQKENRMSLGPRNFNAASKAEFSTLKTKYSSFLLR